MGFSVKRLWVLWVIVIITPAKSETMKVKTHLNMCIVLYTFVLLEPKATTWLSAKECRRGFTMAFTMITERIHTAPKSRGFSH